MVEHYFTQKPTSPLKTTTVSFSYRGKDMKFLCASGVFSSEKIDSATALLLDNAKIEEGRDVLDLGCGIGVIGISIKKTFPSCAVVLSDVNQRALEIAKRNAKTNHVDVVVAESDLYTAFSEKQFHVIITNPPHHAGRELLYKLITDAPSYLKPDGLLQLVASHNKGGAMLERKMKEIFGNVSTLAKKGGFRVYCSRKE
jgi:16S rRNA G1207 methylase RsmC